MWVGQIIIFSLALKSLWLCMPCVNVSMELAHAHFPQDPACRTGSVKSILFSLYIYFCITYSQSCSSSTRLDPEDTSVRCIRMWKWVMSALFYSILLFALGRSASVLRESTQSSWSWSALNSESRPPYWTHLRRPSLSWASVPQPQPHYTLTTLQITFR